MEPEDRWGELVCDGMRRRVPTEPGAYSEFYRLLPAAMRGDAPVPVDPADAAAALDVIEAALLQAPSTSR
jgi:scyllo-inositol 2-dehydrogenase (NADP+)